MVSAEESAGSRVICSPAPPPVCESPLFRFGLRQMLLYVAAICGVLAAMALAGGIQAALILLFAVIVTMHVFATALGTRLQSRTERERLRQFAERPAAGEPSPAALPQTDHLAAIHSAPRSPWHGRGCTYLPWLPRLVVGAMVASALFGIVLLNSKIGHRTSLEGIVVGAASFAVLGGWISFLAGNFFGVFQHGFREALTEQRKDQAGSPANR